ncbi:cytochrome P450 [Paenibacillus chitinolyticus]|uniref:cytochrome P450 family protein n=1 Tax=Paenibacillus chitinolyticus TaxID=79263 RepID=UPI002DB5CBB2|nr:cytochrome P450 [Paenibacillus chitinolyticus]MEC0244383.1 cytochrome P450 [Paenibacillus chitinolyticus]
MEKMTGGDLTSPETMRDIISFYKRLAAQKESLIRLDDFYGMGGAWIAFRHEDVAAMLKDPRLVKDMRKYVPQNEPEAAGAGTYVGKLFEWLRNMPNMLSVDPPDHTRLRRLASKAFTPQMIEGLRPRIQQIADELLDTVQERGRMDLVADFAYPLPINVISEILGIPVADRSLFRGWTQKLLQASVDPSQGSAVEEALEEFIGYIRTLLDAKRRNPGTDVTSGLVQAYEQGDKLSENELLSTIWLLIIAGHETTVNLIGNGTLALLRHPGQMRLLRETPSLLPGAVEEMLRMEGPIVIASRFAGEDIAMHGKVIRQGEIVLLSLAAANVDPQKFSDADTLDITREENEHLAFGKGIHHCLGAPLARLEGQIAFGTLLRRLPDLRLAVEPERLVYNYGKLRSLTSLPVLF